MYWIVLPLHKVNMVLQYSLWWQLHWALIGNISKSYILSDPTETQALSTRTSSINHRLENFHQKTTFITWNSAPHLIRGRCIRHMSVSNCQNGAYTVYQLTQEVGADHTNTTHYVWRRGRFQLTNHEMDIKAISTVVNLISREFPSMCT